jgi:cytochrome c biogenesis protein CcdA
MRKTIAKISGIFATIGAVAIVISNFIGNYGYIPFWIGVVILILSGIAYLATGEKIKKWFWDMLDWF